MSHDDTYGNDADEDRFPIPPDSEIEEAIAEIHQEWTPGEKEERYVTDWLNAVDRSDEFLPPVLQTEGFEALIRAAVYAV